MERWENRYARSRNGDNRGVEHSRAEGVRSIAIILLLVLLAGVGILSVQAFTFRGKCESSMLSRALTECGEAINQVNTLSRSGGSDTATVLARIRANVHVIDAMSTLHQGHYGGSFAPPETFTELYAVIDSYFAKLRTGTNATDELTRLGDQLAVLQELLVKAN